MNHTTRSESSYEVASCYTTQFIFWLPFVRKIQTECEFSEPTEQQQFVRGRAVPAKDARS